MNVFRIKLSANTDRQTWTWLLGLTVFVMISWARADSADAGKFTRLTEKSADIDDQMARMESLVEMRKQSLIDGFIAMELAQQKVNQQMNFLSAKFSGQPAQ